MGSCKSNRWIVKPPSEEYYFYHIRFPSFPLGDTEFKPKLTELHV